MIKRSLLAASALLIGGALPAHSLPVCYMDMGGVRTDLSYMCGDGGGSQAVLSVATPVVPASASNQLGDIYTYGVRANGNAVVGTLWNSGLSAASNITLTIRSEAFGRPSATREVTIDTIGARGEADFVARYNHAPGQWSIENIRVGD